MSGNLNFTIDANLATDAALSQLNSFLNQARGGSEDAARKVNKMLGGKETKEIVFEFDSNIGKVVPAFKSVLSVTDNILKTEEKRRKIEEGSLTNLKGQLRRATQVRDQIKKMKVAVDGKHKGMLVVSDEWRKQNRLADELNRKIADASGNWMKMIQARIPGGKNAMALANGLSQISMAGAAAMAAFQGIQQAIGPMVARAKQVQGFQLAMEGFGLSAKESSQFMSQAKAQSLIYGASLTQVEKGYKRIAPAIMNAGGTMSDVSDAIASLTARTTTLGLTSEQSGRFFEAFAQVMGKGKLQGEELNQQFSELDGALRGQIEDYVRAKHGIQDFDKAMQKGEITSELFLEAFNAISKDMRDNLAGSIGEVQSRIDDMNVTQMQNMVNTLNTITLEGANKTFGAFGKQMMSVILMVSQAFASFASRFPEQQKLMQGIMKAIGGLIQFTVVGILGLLALIFEITEKILEIDRAIRNMVKAAIESLPGMKGFFAGVGGVINGVAKGLARFTDGWMKLGKAAGASEQDLNDTSDAIERLKERAADAGWSAEKLEEEIKKVKDAAQAQMDLSEYNRLGDKLKEIKNDLKEAKAEQKESKGIFDGEKESLEVLKAGVKVYFDDRKKQLAEQKEATKAAYDQELAAIARSKDAMKKRHEAEKINLKARNDAISSSIQREIDALGGKTPAEEKLAGMRKQEIMDKLKSKDLSAKEKLELQAQLERMQRQKQIQEAQLRLKAQKKNAAKAEAALAATQKEEARQLAEEEKALQEQKKLAMKELEEASKRLASEQKEIAKLYDKSRESVDLTGKSLSTIVSLVNSQVNAVDRADKAYKRNIDTVRRLESQQRRVLSNQREIEKRIKSNQAAAQNPKGAAAGGGSVIGGEKWQVNELGREGFMSLSGKMSEIKAPAFGTWKAPSSGTVIPAHLWAGIKAQRASGGPVVTPSATASPSGLMARINSLGRAGSNDVVTNNVTIQSDNVDRTMQQSLVTLRRTKRARYY